MQLLHRSIRMNKKFLLLYILFFSSCNAMNYITTPIDKACSLLNQLGGHIGHTFYSKGKKLRPLNQQEIQEVSEVMRLLDINQPIYCFADLKPDKKTKDGFGLGVFNHIYFPITTLQLLSNPKKATIGHELIHVKRYHSLKRFARGISIPSLASTCFFWLLHRNNVPLKINIPLSAFVFLLTFPIPFPFDKRIRQGRGKTSR